MYKMQFINTKQLLIKFGNVTYKNSKVCFKDIIIVIIEINK